MKTSNFYFFFILILTQILLNISSIKIKDTTNNYLREGMIIGLRSRQFNNVFIRLDGSNCAKVGKACGVVNTQFGEYEWERFIVHKVTSDTFCFENNNFKSVYLGLNASNCGKPEGSGCGKTYAVRKGNDKCTGELLFRWVPINNDAFALQSVKYPHAFLRADGNGMVSRRGNGGGIVNAQYYGNGAQVIGYEVFTRTITKDVQEVQGVQEAHFREGMVVGFRSNVFNNVYVRLETNDKCKNARNGSPCGLVNAQFGQYSMEKFIIHQVTEDTFCFESDASRGFYLALDPSTCTIFNGSGCGRVFPVKKGDEQCSGNLLFRPVMLDNTRFGLQSVKKPGVYLRVDGHSVVTKLGSGGGLVNAQVWGDQKPKSHEVFTLTINVDTNASHTVKGLIKCAITGQLLPAATLKANSLTIKFGNYLATVNPDTSSYQVTLPNGIYKRTANLQGYVTDVQENVIVNRDSDGPENTVLLSPLFNGWRFVLTWERFPADLDAYLKLPDGNLIYYKNKNGDNVKLDVDKRDGFGPETITLNKAVKGNYIFYVKNYSKEKPLNESGAKLKVLGDNRELEEIDVPSHGDGVYWKVFELDGDNGKLKVINEISDHV